MSIEHDRSPLPPWADSLPTLPAPPRREQASIQVELTELEVRSVVRATTLVADLLRPELFRTRGSEMAESPLITAYQTLVAACERAGIDLGLGAGVRREPTSG
jgi:hypothetical protein